MQGRYKKDSGAAGDPEPHGATPSQRHIDRSGRGPEPRRPADDAATAGPGQAGANGGSSAAGTARGSSGTNTVDGDVEPPAPVNPSGKHASRAAMRNWSIRTRLVSLVALPVVAATTLGALRIESSLQNVSQLDNMKLLTDMTGHATKLADALQTERDSSAGPIASGHSGDDQVVASRQATDQQIQGFDKATESINEGNDASLIGVRSTIMDITRQLQSLKQIRASAYTNPQYISQTVSGYDQLINSLLALSQDMAQATSNPDIIRSTRALAAFTAAKEYESMQRAVISAALANPSGPTLSQSDRLYAQTASDSESSEMQRFNAIYGQGAAVLTKALDGGNTVITQADQYRDRVLKTPNAISQNPESYLDFYDQADTKIQEMSRIEQELLDQMSQKALTLRSSAQEDALINGAVILLVLGISLIGAFVVARSMIRSLRRLQDTAKDVAQKRLPELVKQLSESDPQDVDTSVTSIGISTRDEIGQVARAFDEVHREAVRLAAEQALLRGNVNAMFTNLSRRSQGLIQRQLSLISELESREADPDQLSNLFKLDHLATRMRRNGENLLVLAGEEPGRRWTRPVPLVDVLRAAASEVEQYERIELTAVPPTEVAGRIVNDLVHLLAELLENATSFSSPQTKVRVTGHALPDGRVLIEIHDTGIGLSPEDLSDINERLANPPTVDVSVSRRMGLFVVGRLSLRHGIRIQLRPSDSGGTTALVMLPVDLTQGGGKAQGNGKTPTGAGAGQGAAKRGAAAAAIASASAGAGAGIGAASGQLGRTPQRGQVPSAGRRPALTGSHEASGQDGRQQPLPRTSAGLPTRQGADATSPQPPQPQQQSSSQQPIAERPAPSWAQSDRSDQDVPRGHDDMESTSRFERPGPGGGRHSGPHAVDEFGDSSTTSQIPIVPNGRGPAHPGLTGDPFSGNGYAEERYSRNEATGDFRAPQGGPAQQNDRFGAARPDGSDGGSTAEYRAPQFGQSQPGGGFRGPIGAGSGSDVFGAPNRGPSRDDRGPSGPTSPAGPGGVIPRGGTSSADGFGAVGGGRDGRNVRDVRDGLRDDPPSRAPQQRPDAQLPPASEPMALPPSGSQADVRSPIFESLESDWFRGGEGDAPPARQQPPTRPQRQPQAQQPQPSRRPQQPQPPHGPAPQAPQRSRATENSSQEWRTSPNDDGWRRAGQLREPSSGGVTSSGLPRRVPRANLVPGTAEQSQQTGPQVSRAPDAVRGRLTNLRRGIQQGRSAGTDNTDGRGFSTPHQQER